jgi:tetratricopeptide (TPR) repeat protein
MRIPASIALKTASSQREASKWPHRALDSRLSTLARPIQKPKFTFEKTERIFTIGSCFARNVEEYLDRLGFEVPTLKFSVPAEEWAGRPSGILNKYTPPTLFQEIDRASRALDAPTHDDFMNVISESLLRFEDGNTIDMELTGYAAVTFERAVERRISIHNLFSQMFECSVVTLTFGLTESWFDELTQRYILKAPTPEIVKAFPERFTFEVLEIDQVLEHAARSIELLNARGSTKKIIVTTSPVPLSRTFRPHDILLTNEESKATLRVACGAVARKYENVDYFPAYEIAMLSTDPNRWSDDLIHLSDDFVGKIVFQLLAAYAPGLDLTVDATSQAWALFKAKENAAAIHALEGMDTSTASTLRGLAMIASGMGARGLEEMKRGATEADLTAEQALQVAALLYGFKQYEMAIAIVDRVRGGTDDQMATSNSRAAICLSHLGREAEALGRGRLALEKRRSQTVFNMVGWVALRAGDLEWARSLFEATVSLLQPFENVAAAQRGDALLGLARISVKQGRVVEARSLLQLAEWNWPLNPELKNVRAEIRDDETHAP